MLHVAPRAYLQHTTEYKVHMEEALQPAFGRFGVGTGFCFRFGRRRMHGHRTCGTIFDCG